MQTVRSLNIFPEQFEANANMGEKKGRVDLVPASFRDTNLLSRNCC